MSNSKVIGFIGAGKMATAIACGLSRQSEGEPTRFDLRAYDILPAAREAFLQASGHPCFDNADAAVDGADVVLLAVKPQYAADALAPLAKNGKLKDKLLISIVAGWSVEKLQKHSGANRIIRVMPNTPALVGEAMSCYACSDGADKQDATLAESILSSFGKVCRVSESQMDAVTGLSGSGPAYVMEFIMGLADGGVYCGLSRQDALKLAIQTVLGTAKMCNENPKAIAQLRDAVISPAGTTACGILTLQENGFKGIAAKAVIAGARRSAELGK